MIRVANETDLLQCPYEPSHQILKARFQVHLGRCGRQHKNVPKVTCPFNVTHILNKPELDWHVSVCSDRMTFEKFRNPDTPTTQPTVPPRQQELIIESSENWDDDPVVSSYNPMDYVEKAPVLRHLQGAAPSKKKEFREKERLRHLGIDKYDFSDPSKSRKRKEYVMF